MIPISDNRPLHIPVRPPRRKSSDDGGGDFDSLLIDRVEAMGGGEEGRDESSPGRNRKDLSDNSDTTTGDLQGPADESGDPGLPRGRKIDLRA